MHTASLNDDLAIHGRPARSDGCNEGPWRLWVDRPEGSDTHRIQPFHHNFHEHPLMALPRLARLAESLWPKGQCRFMVPESTDATPLSSAFRLRSPDGRHIDEVFRHLDEPDSWVALYNVESDPDYRAFLAEVIAAARSSIGQAHTGIFRVCGYLFLSAPPSVTPFHIDRENNLWLQLRGRKTLTVWDRQDRDVVPAEAVEKFILTGSLDDVKLDDSMRGRGRTFDSGPGDGVFFPSTSPHMTRSDTRWTSPGDGVTVSMGVVFYSSETLRDARVHLCNRSLRRLGLPAAFPGRHPWMDAAKAPVGALLARHRKMWPDVSAWSYFPEGH